MVNMELHGFQADATWFPLVSKSKACALNVETTWFPCETISQLPCETTWCPHKPHGVHMETYMMSMCIPIFGQFSSLHVILVAIRSQKITVYFESL